MARRRYVAIASAAMLLGVGLIAGLIVVSLTRTSYGQERVRSYIETRLASRVQGTMYIGRISGGFLTGVTIDSLEIRGRDDSLFIATGPVTVEYDPRDIFDRRILLQRLVVERPVVNLTQYANGEWNWRRIFPDRPRGRVTSTLDRGFGDYIVADTAIVHDGTLVLTLPWEPDERLSRAQRDSSIETNLERADIEIRRRDDGFARTRRWTQAQASGGVRWSDPQRAGHSFDVRSLSVHESDPPLQIVSANGAVRVLGDSLWLDVPHFDLPGSTGRAEGKVVWGSDLPMRYDVRIRGDSVSLSDLNWVYATLPISGGGSMDLHIRNADDLDVMEYALTNMDVRTTGSHLRGAMTFGVGDPVLSVTDVDMRASPLDFRFIETLSGGPLPVPWAGTINGTVRARGGPLTRFQVDDAVFTFADANVPGAVSRGSASGGLNILQPALAVFHGLDVQLEQLDLRSIQHLYPLFPPVGGIASGRALLDSSWMDVRFRNADITHTVGADPVSRVTGAGRITLADPFIVYDVDLLALPLSLTALSRTYPALPGRGVVTGPLRIRGTLDNMEVTTTLTHEAGTFAFDGRVDAYEPVYSARGRAELVEMDVPRFLARTDIPAATISSRLLVDMSGSSLDNLSGTMRADVDRSIVGGIRFFPSYLQLGFNDGLMRVDTVSLTTSAGHFDGSGAIGLTGARRDSIAYTMRIDSLGGLRRFLPVAEGDSLGGWLRMQGMLSGSLDNADISGSFRGDELVMRNLMGQVAVGELEIRSLGGAWYGEVGFGVSQVTAAGFELDSVQGKWTLLDPWHARFSLGALSPAGPRIALAGDYAAPTADSSTFRFDTLSVAVGEDHWKLNSPAFVTAARGNVTLDSAVMHSERGGRFAMRADLPAQGAIDLRVALDSFALGNFQLLAQLPTALDGWGSVDAQVTGTRAEPVIAARGALTGAGIGDVRLERLDGRVNYAARVARADLDMFRGGARVLAASGTLPVDLALVPVPNRLLDAPISGSIRADSVELGVVEAFTPLVRGATGRLTTDVAIQGTWERPEIAGTVRVVDGGVDLPAAGIRLTRLNADVALTGDSAHIRRFSAMSGSERGDTASLTGHVAFREFRDPFLNLRFAARNFRAVQRPRVADLRISSDLALNGRYTRSVLTGTVNVVQGALFIPELAQKRLIELSDIDTTLTTDRALLGDAPSTFVENLELRGVRVLVGDQVWLRSAEGNTNIQLGGEVNVQSVRAAVPIRVASNGAERADSVYRLALEGSLNADRGDYRLDLGVVQRKFQVEQGRVIFFGDADLNPTLDISAIHTVRRGASADAGRDINIRVRIVGTLAQYQLQLESADGLPISESDLLSYLVTGSPSFELGAAGRAHLGTAAAILLPSLGSWIGDRFAGGRFDVFQLETARLGEFERESFRDFFFGTRLGVGKQFGARTFVSANTNLCQIGNIIEGKYDAEKLIESIGVKLEHRLNHDFLATMSAEPSSATLICRPEASLQRGFVSTPLQLGADLFKVWRF
jgi:translocation and assembly module TamB